MRWLTFAIGVILVVSGCASSAPASTNAAPPAKPAKEGAVSKPPDAPAPSTVDGIRVTVDGQTFDIPGEIKVSREKGVGTSILRIGKNPSPSALVGGNGVLLEISAAPGKDELKEGFSAADVAVVTFTVWKGVEFSYISTGAIPGQPMKGLAISQKGGKLSGSFEDNLNGTLGKLRARVEFGVALPK